MKHLSVTGQKDQNTLRRLHPGRMTHLGIAGLALMLSACGAGGSRLTCIDPSGNPAATETKNPLQGIKVNIGIDGSGSMFGFVSQPGSRYGQAIDSLNTLIAAKGLSGQTSYWRLGNGNEIRGPQQIDAARFLAARTPEFYCTGGEKTFPCVSSTLHQLYEQPTPIPQQRLDILLTDLEPNSGAIGDLTQKFRQLLDAHPDYKVMLLGVRSEYNGPIYPAQQNAFNPFQYSADGKNVDQLGRPFYVLISGPPRAVDEIIQAFRDLPMQVSQAFRAVAFSRHRNSSDVITLDSPATWANPKTTDCLSEISAFDRSVPEQPQQWLLGAVRSACSSSPFKFDITSAASPTLIGAKLHPNVFKLRDESQVVQVRQTTVSDGRLRLQLALNPKALANQTRPKPILLDLDRKALNQALWQDWDTSVDNPAGPKTQNLMLFINSMETLISKDNSSEPAVRFCMGLEQEIGTTGSSHGRPLLLLLILPLVLLLLIGGGITLARSSHND